MSLCCVAEACGQRPPPIPCSPLGKKKKYYRKYLGLLELDVLNIVHITTDRIDKKIHYICVFIYK